MLIKAYMLPHPPIAVAEIGQGEERKIQATLDGFAKVAEDIAVQRPDTIIVMSPHAICYRDYFHISDGVGDTGDFSRFGRADVKISVSYDEKLRSAIVKRATAEHFPAGCEGGAADVLTADHGTLVPLYFINRKYTDYKLVRIGLSGFPLSMHEDLGRMIRRVCDEDLPQKRVVFLASGDLSHCQREDGPYGYDPAGPAYDAKLMEVLGRGALSELAGFSADELRAAQECGHRSFVTMSGVLGGTASAKIFSHEATFGVGYGTGIFEEVER